jgi:hypothetical protein
MKYSKMLLCVVLTLALTVYANAAGSGNGKGFMGGDGVMKDAPTGGGGGGEEGGTEGGGGQMPDGAGPLGDQGAVQGELYGDLYVLLRYKGGEQKNVPAVNTDGTPIWNSVTWTCPAGHLHPNVKQQAWATATAIGGEPILTENFVAYKVVDEDTQLEVPYSTDPLCYWWPAPTPSQCVQPVASFKRWGDLRDVVADTNPSHATLENVQFNTIPIVMTYDPTWDRTEFVVGTLADPTYFIPPGGQGLDPNNNWVTYVDGVLWADLIQEVSFGRLNQARATEAVLQASFDEAITSINAALAIRIDSAGRLLLTQWVYDEYRVFKESQTFSLNGFEVAVKAGDPLIIGTADKAIDSPLENLAIYLKLMRDGHLVTPGDQRDTIDRSEQGGIPVDLLLGMEDGPSTGLRPTIDIAKMRSWNLGSLVDVSEVTYYTYYEVITEGGTVVDYVLRAVTTPPVNVEYQTWVGIPTADGSVPAAKDFEFCAAALSAAADKGGKLTVDHVVYLNSILGINKVVGTNEDGTIDYAKTPQYFNYGAAPTYSRTDVFSARGFYQPADPQGDLVTGQVLILAAPAGTGGDPVSGVWVEYPVSILSYVPFRELGVDEVTRFPNSTTATFNIGGFAQGADDNLSLIDFVHTYQIPANR